MFITKYPVGILTLTEEKPTSNEYIEMLEVSELFAFDPNYLYDIIDGKLVKMDLIDQELKNGG